MKCQTLISGGVRGTLPWMAPELLNGSSSLVSEKVCILTLVIELFLMMISVVLCGPQVCVLIALCRLMYFHLALCYGSSLLGKNRMQICIMGPS